MKAKKSIGIVLGFIVFNFISFHFIGLSEIALAANCEERQLSFSADELLAVPAPNSPYVWGGNATGGDHLISPPFERAFLNSVRIAKQRNIESFAYLEGPCGDTDGVDDGERSRCARLHREFNRRHSPNTPDTALERWKPYTLAQMKFSQQFQIDYCEIDNLENNVSVPLLPLLREIKSLYDKGAIHCRLVLKNISLAALAAIQKNLAPTPESADFIAPFHIYEANNLRLKPALDEAMRKLKGPGAVTIISTDTNHYGRAFTPDRFLSCKKSVR